MWALKKEQTQSSFTFLKVDDNVTVTAAVENWKSLRPWSTSPPQAQHSSIKMCNFLKLVSAFQSLWHISGDSSIMYSLMDYTESKIQSQTNLTCKTNRTDRCEKFVQNNPSSTSKYLSNYGTPEHEHRNSKSQIIRQTKLHLTWCCRMEHRANLLWIPPDSDYNIKEVSEAAAWTHRFSFYFTQIFGHVIFLRYILHMHYFSLYFTHIFLDALLS